MFNLFLRDSLALVLSVCLLSAGFVQATNYTWTNGGGDSNWATGGNWNPGGPPDATGYALFYGGGGTVNLPDGATTLGTLGIWQDWTPWSFGNSAATLTVGGLYVSDTWVDVNFAPVVNVTGSIYTYATYVTGEIYLNNNGNTVGGLNINGDPVDFAGNNNTVHGSITVLGDSPASWSANHYG